MSNEHSSETAEQFLQRYIDITTKGYTTLCLAVGHKLKLFNHIPDCPSTSEEIAKAAGLKERYVREWLNSMVVGDIVEATEDGHKYWLPKERRQMLLSGNQNLAVYFPLFTNVFDPIVSCFKLDGPSGMPYSAYSEFHAIIAEANSRMRSSTFLTSFIPSVPRLTERLDNGIVCLDVGCGAGVPSLMMAKTFKNSTCYGFDFVESAIELANAEKAKHNLDNLFYYAYDAANLPEEWSNKFDYVTAFDAIHDQAYPDKALSEIYRVLKPGGHFSMVDINAHTNVKMNKHSFAKFFYAASLFHCMPVSLYFEGGMGLGICWGKEKAAEMLREAGLSDINFTEEVENLFNYHCTAQKPVK